MELKNRSEIEGALVASYMHNTALKALGVLETSVISSVAVDMSRYSGYEKGDNVGLKKQFNLVAHQEEKQLMFDIVRSKPLALHVAFGAAALKEVYSVLKALADAPEWQSSTAIERQDKVKNYVEKSFDEGVSKIIMGLGIVNLRQVVDKLKDLTDPWWEVRGGVPRETRKTVDYAKILESPSFDALAARQRALLDAQEIAALVQGADGGGRRSRNLRTGKPIPVARVMKLDF